MIAVRRRPHSYFLAACGADGARWGETSFVISLFDFACTSVSVTNDLVSSSISFVSSSRARIHFCSFSIQFCSMTDVEEGIGRPSFVALQIAEIPCAVIASVADALSSGQYLLPPKQESVSTKKRRHIKKPYLAKTIATPISFAVIGKLRIVVLDRCTLPVTKPVLWSVASIKYNSRLAYEP